MSDLKWIKLYVDIFKNRKIRRIEGMENGDSIVLIWCKLLCLAGEINDCGKIYFTQNIPYDIEGLSVELSKDISLVEKSLKVFEEFEMTDTVDGMLHIRNWGEYQYFDKPSNAKEKHRESQEKYRKKLREHNVAVANEENQNLDGNKQKPLERDKFFRDNLVIDGDITGDSVVIESDAIDKEEDKDKELEKEDDKDKEDRISFGVHSANSHDVRAAIDEWNKLSCLGITPVKWIAPKSMRYRSLSARIEEYGLDAFIDAVQKVSESPFLRGRNNKGWTITLDWFVKPANFVKVAEGQYAERAGQKSYENANRKKSSAEILMQMVDDGVFGE